MLPRSAPEPPYTNMTARLLSSDYSKILHLSASQRLNVVFFDAKNGTAI
jgi:hypothetical protein